MDQPKRKPLTDDHKSLYPTFPTTDQAIVEAVSQLPITDFNHLYAVLMVYHNSLRAELLNAQET